MRHIFPVVLLLSLPLVSCTAEHFADPISVITSHGISSEKRQAAERQAELEIPNDPRFAQAMRTLLWEPHFTTEDRLYAVQQLIRIDESGFREELSRRLLILQDYEVLLYIFHQAVERHWTDFTPAVIRSYARTIHGLTEKQRPEPGVIEKLNPGKTVEPVIVETFADRDGRIRPQDQAAAWNLINRLMPREKVLALVAQAPGSSPMVLDLKAAAADLHTVPINAEGVLWLAYLREPARWVWWDRAKTIVASLTPEQRQGLELRHLPILMQCDPDTFKMTRASMVDEVAADLGGAEHHVITSPIEGQEEDYPQMFSQWVDKLSWADLVTIRFLNRVVQEPAVTSQLFDQAMADYHDTSTEYGGVIDVGGPGAAHPYVANLYVPEICLGDTRFLPPPAMIQELYTGLAHYHFHAQRLNNAQYACPGRGDLETADQLNFNFLVFTFIDKDRLNVDYYSRGGIIVDLGTLHR